MTTTRRKVSQSPPIHNGVYDGTPHGAPLTRPRGIGGASHCCVHSEEGAWSRHEGCRTVDCNNVGHTFPGFEEVDRCTAFVEDRWPCVPAHRGPLCFCIGTALVTVCVCRARCGSRVTSFVCSRLFTSFIPRSFSSSSPIYVLLLLGND